jgi:hypothetical protein
MVIFPESCPVTIFAPPGNGGSARNSNDNPCWGSSAEFSTAGPPQQRIEQAVLGDFDLLPRREIGELPEVGNDAVVPTREAHRLGVVRRCEPIARIVFGVGAKAACAIGIRQRRSAAVRLRLHCRERAEVGQIGEPVAALAAGAVSK